MQPDPGRSAKANRYDVIEVPDKEVMDPYSKPSMLWTKVAYLYGPNRNLHNGHLRTCLEMYHRRQAALSNQQHARQPKTMSWVDTWTLFIYQLLGWC